MQKYDKVLMQTAKLWAEQSYCKRAKVGAVIAKDGRILSVGYNGTPSGSENRCEKLVRVCPNCSSEDFKEYNDIIICKNCNDIIRKIRFEKRTMYDKVIHAEANAILFCAKNGISTKDTTLYVTMSPCKECAKMIIQSGIKRVVFEELYRDSDLDFLKNSGVIVEQLEGE